MVSRGFGLQDLELVCEFFFSPEELRSQSRFVEWFCGTVHRPPESTEIPLSGRKKAWFRLSLNMKVFLWSLFPGPDHNKQFNAQVILENKIIGKGIGKSKKNAEQMAAKDAFSKMS